MEDALGSEFFFILGVRRSSKLKAQRKRKLSSFAEALKDGESREEAISWKFPRGGAAY